MRISDWSSDVCSSDLIDDFGVIGNGGHVFNLGHGISRFTPPAAVQVLVDEVHTYSRSSTNSACKQGVKPLFFLLDHHGCSQFTMLCSIVSSRYFKTWVLKDRKSVV